MDVKAQLHMIANCPYFPPEGHRPLEQRRRRLAVEQEIDKLTRRVSKKYPDLPLLKAEYFLHGKARQRFQALLCELKEMSCVHLVTQDRQRDHAETPRPSGGRQDGMTLKDWVYLVWTTATLYDGHPGSEDIHGILDRIGAPYGFTVEDALNGYEPARLKTLSEFSLQHRDKLERFGSGLKPA
jgi:hypothetical protein